MAKTTSKTTTSAASKSTPNAAPTIQADTTYTVEGEKFALQSEAEGYLEVLKHRAWIEQDVKTRNPSLDTPEKVERAVKRQMKRLAEYESQKPREGGEAASEGNVRAVA